MAQRFTTVSPWSTPRVGSSCGPRTTSQRHHLKLKSWTTHAVKVLHPASAKSVFWKPVSTTLCQVASSRAQRRAATSRISARSSSSWKMRLEEAKPKRTRAQFNIVNNQIGFTFSIQVHLVQQMRSQTAKSYTSAKASTKLPILLPKLKLKCK